MESTLAVTYQRLLSYVGNYLGYGRGAAEGQPEWEDDKLLNVREIVDSGLRQFYSPPRLPNEPVAHQWSFLKPQKTLTLLSGENTAPLPDDFGGFEGDLQLYSDTGVSWWSIPTGNDGDVWFRHSQQPSTTGRPRVAASEWLKGTGGKSGQRARLVVWPTADQDYSIRCNYYFHPNALTESLPYALGGMGHGETLVESCLSIAEQRLMDVPGLHTAKFMERLAASISLDRAMRPQSIGYNRDGADPRYQDPRRIFDGAIRVNGVIPT